MSAKTRQFYTSNGWQGQQYQKTKDLPLKEIAKRIKKEILAKHPDIKISVSTDFFSCGCSIEIRVKEVPFKAFRKEPTYPGQTKYFTIHYTEKAKALMDDIQKIANQYRYDDSDGMIDYFNTNFYCHPEFDWELRSREEKELGLI